MTSFIKHQMWLSSICSKTEAGEGTTKLGGELLFHFLLDVELSTLIQFLFNETLLSIIKHVLQYRGVPSLKPTTRSHPDLQHCVGPCDYVGVTRLKQTVPFNSLQGISGIFRPINPISQCEDLKFHKILIDMTKINENYTSVEFGRQDQLAQ